MSDNNITGKTALITGGSKGIGAALARSFLQDGVGTLYLAARSSPAYSALQDSLEGLKSSEQRVVYINSDLADSSAVIGLVEQIAADPKGLDILINNAGFTAPQTIFEASFEELRRTMEVNLYAPFLLIQGLLQKGNKFQHIVNIASTAGMRGRAGWSTYSSSKAALIALSQALREELLPIGTRVSYISPGRCATDLRKVLAPDEDPTTIMQPEDVARVITMLLSDLGHYIDSENMVVRL
jgi:3-oxoacyl-[acyl-carrier protein] reductase